MLIAVNSRGKLLYTDSTNIKNRLIQLFFLFSFSDDFEPIDS